MTSRSDDDAPSTVVRAVSEDEQGQGALRALAPAITILWHYDLNRVGKSAPLDRHRTEVSRHTAPFDLDVDSAVSRAPFLIVEQRYGFVTLTPAGTRTSILVDGVPLTTPQDIDDQVLRKGVILTLGERIVVCLHQVRTPVLRGPDLGFVGGSDVMEDVRRQIRDVADLDVAVLIRGASGTGKELVARAIAAASAAPTPYVDVNLAERGSTMVASELFGHQKGAFTGATTARAGYFAEADGGTLFIDEVGGGGVPSSEPLEQPCADDRFAVLVLHIIRTGGDRDDVGAPDVDLRAATSVDEECCVRGAGRRIDEVVDGDLFSVPQAKVASPVPQGAVTGVNHRQGPRRGTEPRLQTLSVGVGEEVDRGSRRGHMKSIGELRHLRRSERDVRVIRATLGRRRYDEDQRDGRRPGTTYCGRGRNARGAT